MAFTSTLSKLQAATRISSLSTTRSPFQMSRAGYGAMATYDQCCDAAKKGVDVAKRGVQQLKTEAASTADNATRKTEGVAGQVSNTAQEATGKMKQTAEDAWGTAKDTARKITDTVTSKAEATADCAKGTIREEAAKVNRT